MEGLLNWGKKGEMGHGECALAPNEKKEDINYIGTAFPLTIFHLLG
jgi:hypothetical protein